MIPWANFDNGSRQDLSGDVQVQLHEHWLAWVEHGPSMTTLFLESPMLEIAHERQFVTSQLGGHSHGFELEHTRRMRECLRQLEDYFRGFATNDACCPGSPHRIDLSCCWEPEISLDTLTPLRLSPEETVGGRSLPRLDHVSSLSPESSTTTSTSTLTPTPTPTLIVPPHDKVEDHEMADDADEHLEQLLQNLPRAGTVLPLHGARAQKTQRQRRKIDSKLATDVFSVGKKRNSEWMVDKDEENATITLRSQSITSLRANYDRNVNGEPSRKNLCREET